MHDNTILAYFTGHVDEIIGIEVSPSSSLFLSTAKNEEVRLWDYYTKECLAIFNETCYGSFDNTGQVLALAYVSDKKQKVLLYSLKVTPLKFDTPICTFELGSTEEFP